MAFADLQVGANIPSRARTITQTHIVNYLGVSGIAVPMFVDIETAKRSSHGGPIVPGFLTLSIAIGLLEEAMDLSDLIAVLGFDQIRFVRPVRPDDTIHIQIEIAKKRTTKAGQGVVTGEIVVANQRDEPVASFEITWLFENKGAAA
jgi:acyl dehydratase